MTKIGGNVTAVIQTKTTQKNSIGERITTWNDVKTLKGFLDIFSGNSSRTTFDAKTVQAEPVFICDYTPLPASVSVENSRLKIGNDYFDITYIDNPMNLNYQLEFSLSFTGGIGNG